MLIRTNKRCAAERGSALVPALLVVMAVSALSVTYLQLSLSKSREGRAEIDKDRAFNMAEAGLAEGFNGLVMGKSGNVGSEVLPARFANGLFWTTCVEESSGRCTLTSTGMCGAGRASLSMTIAKKSASIASQGMFADQGLIVEEGSLIDGYDSRLVPAGTSLLKGIADLLKHEQPSGAKLSSNGDITIQPGVTIYGDARPGPDHTVVRGRNAVVTGSTAPNESAQPVRAIDVPTVAKSSNPDFNAASVKNKTITIASGDHGYETLGVGNKQKLVLQGPATIVVSKLDVASGGELVIDSTYGPVALYVTDWFNLATGSMLETIKEEAGSVQMLVTASKSVDRNGDGTVDRPVTIDSTGKYFGTFYAPSAAVSWGKNQEVYGSLAAGLLTLRSGSKVHFDLALEEAVPSPDNLPELLGWRIEELPSVPLVSLHYDALDSLKVAGKIPLLSSVAHLLKDEVQQKSRVKSRGGKRARRDRDGDGDDD